MSTSATILDQGTIAALPLKYENLEFAVIVKTNEEGKITAVRHSQRDKDIANLESSAYPHTDKEKASPELIAFKQVVKKVIVGTIEGFEELFPNPEHRLAIINKGVDQQFNSKIRTTLIEQDASDNLVFQPTDAPYDATSLVQDVSNRGVKLTEGEIALKALSGLKESNPVMFAAIIAQFAAAATA